MISGIAVQGGFELKATIEWAWKLFGCRLRRFMCQRLINVVDYLRIHRPAIGFGIFANSIPHPFRQADYEFVGLLHFLLPSMAISHKLTMAKSHSCVK